MMSDYVQAVVDRKHSVMYIGGGKGCLDHDNNYVIMMYDTSSGQWTKLPQYTMRYFTMAVIKSQLVLVGGRNHSGHKSKELGVWNAERKNWIHSFPEMLTPRSRCSAVVYQEWLVVAGGKSSGGVTSSVEVLNTDNKQWHAGPPTPVPWRDMKTAIVGDVCYFMGGATKRRSATVSTDSVYSVSFPALISHHYSKTPSGMDSQIWNEISGLLIEDSTPLSIGGYLLAVSGWNTHSKAVSGVHLYNPDSGKWVKVGDLPTPRYYSICTMITDKELIAGGYGMPRRMDIAHCSISH